MDAKLLANRVINRLIPFHDCLPSGRQAQSDLRQDIANYEQGGLRDVWGEAEYRAALSLDTTVTDFLEACESGNHAHANDIARLMLRRIKALYPDNMHRSVE